MVERMHTLADAITSEQPMDEDQFQKYADEYQMLLGEFSANLDTYTEEELKLIVYDIGRINGVIASREASNYMRDIIGSVGLLPSLANGFMDGFDVESLPLNELEEMVVELQDGIIGILNNYN